MTKVIYSMVASEKELYERVLGKKKPRDLSDPIMNFLAYNTLAETQYDIISNTFKRILRAKSKSPIEGRVERLEKEVSEIRLLLKPRQRVAKADVIYDKFRKALEKDCFGKIVAIDIDSEKIVGHGNTVLEAFRDAESKTGKKRFSYRKVGYTYVYRL